MSDKENMVLVIENQLALDDIKALRAENEQLRAIVQKQEDQLNRILQPGERWLELFNEYRRSAGEEYEWFAKNGELLSLAMQRTQEAIHATLKEMVKR